MCKEICESERQTIITHYEVSTSIKRQKAQPPCAWFSHLVFPTIVWSRGCRLHSATHFFNKVENLCKMYCVASPASSPHKKERLSFARWIFACGSKRSLKRRVHLAMTALSSAFLFAGGHLAILLAHLLPNSTFILVENKAESLQRAIERTKKLHLTNCQFFQGESTRNTVFTWK